MSYILNAIRKSEQDRQAGQPEKLENRIQERQEDVQKKNPIWIIILVIINICFLSYFIWSYNQEDEKAPVSEPAIAPVTLKTQNENKEITIPPTVLSRLPEEQKEQKEFVSTPPTVPVTQKTQEENTEHLMPPPAVLSRLTKEHQETIAERIKQLRLKSKKNAKTIADRPVLKKQEQKSIVSATSLNQPEIRKATDKTEIKGQKEKYNEPPYLSELDYEFRRRVPDIDVNVFVYNEKEEDRFIMINMKKYKTGQDINQGMTLKEIRMNSIVVEYRDKLFQFKR